jgi:hypothetical protein
VSHRKHTHTGANSKLMTFPRFLADKYKIDMSSASNTNNLSSAIKRGSEKGELLLPKGVSGRVKLPPKVSHQSCLRLFPH